MTKVQWLKQEVKKLNKPRLEAFQNWLQRYDLDAWDARILKDARSGKLYRLSKAALAAHKAGKTSKLVA